MGKSMFGECSKYLRLQIGKQLRVSWAIVGAVSKIRVGDQLATWL